MGAGKGDGVLFVAPPFEEKEAVFEDVFCPLLTPSKVGLTRRGNKNLSLMVLYYTQGVSSESEPAIWMSWRQRIVK